MTLQVESQKRGGPYTKPEQELRRDKVYELYYEKGFSAVQTAKELGVNRNTVNEDIKYWAGQIASKYGRENIHETLTRQIEMLELQKKRLMDSMESLEFDARFKVEKLIFDIDYKRASFVSKIGGFSVAANLISDEVFSDIVRQLCLSEKTLYSKMLYPERFSEEEIKKEIFAITSSDTKYVSDFFNSLIEKGLRLFTVVSSFGISYDLLSFAVGRKIISKEEHEEVFRKRKESEKKEEERYSNIEKKYKKKYGSDMSKWSSEVKDQMDREMFGGI